GTQYGFVVRACNTPDEGDTASNCGQDSAAAPATPYRPADPVQNLAVTATPGSQQVSATWDAPANDGGRAVAGYEYSVDGGGWTDNGANTTLTLSGKPNGTQVTVAVHSYSAEQQGRNGADAQGQATPYGNPGTPSGLKAAASPTSANRVTLKWTASNGNGRDIVNYQYQIDMGGWQDTGAGAATQVTITAAKGTHKFAVKAVGSGEDPQRQLSEPSDSVDSDTVWDPIAAPNVDAAKSGDDAVAFTWSAPADNG